ncbi:aminopeptidase N [Vibrio sp.]|nr:aminopeptidase N [Vibrio sp.]
MSDMPLAKYRKDYRAPSHHISHIDLTFELHDTATRVEALSTVTQTSDDNTLILSGEHLELERIDVNGEQWHDYKVSDGHLTLQNLPTSFSLHIITIVDPVGNTALEGLYKSEGAFCTQCEAEGFRRITYYLDRPDILAVYTTTVIADKAQYPFLLSNGNKVDSGLLEEGKHWVKWHDPHPKPSYLFALVAGDFDVLTDQYVTRSGREVALEIFVDKGNLDRAEHAMLSLVNSMKWDEERFDLEYDLDIYMIVAVDFFNMGAMENKGLNVFNSKFVLANNKTATDTDYLGIEAVIGHEYFHNWTGNRVTCRDWFQLSLKEGLTVFRDQEFSSDLGSRAVNRIKNVRIIRGPQFAEDASPMSHPIRPDKVIEMNNFYTLTVYEKGSEVIRMIHTLLGEEQFQNGMKRYFDNFDGTAATCEDFVVSMEEASGVDLTQFRLWYSQSGTPQVSVETDYDSNAKTYTITLTQTTPPTKEQTEKQALHIPFDVELYRADGTVIPLQIDGLPCANVLNFTQNKQAFIFDNIEETPVPSLLRNFSAPVSLAYEYSDSELIFLMSHAQDKFARWDAGQMLLAKYIKQFVEQENSTIALPNEVIDAFRGTLLSDSLEPEFIAEVLTLPTHNEVSGWYATIDVDRIALVLEALTRQLAEDLMDELSATYYSLMTKEYSLSHDEIGKRSLKNVCLSYLAYTEVASKLISMQFNSANNMTDKIAAMGAANRSQLSIRDELMLQYSDEWKHDGLVMDKWFMLQGSNPAETALDQLKEAMKHEAFTLQNPNRIRSLIGSFLNNNPIRFHDKSGAGYEFAGEILHLLNESNPQVASRLIDPLLKFKKYDIVRQELIRAELKKLQANPKLAKDLFEKVSKALSA